MSPLYRTWEEERDANAPRERAVSPSPSAPEQAFTWLATNYPKALREMPTDTYHALRIALAAEPPAPLDVERLAQQIADRVVALLDTAVARLAREEGT